MTRAFISVYMNNAPARLGMGFLSRERIIEIKRETTHDGPGPFILVKSIRL